MMGGISKKAHGDNQTRIRTSTGIWIADYNAENRPTRFTRENTEGSSRLDRSGTNSTQMGITSCVWSPLSFSSFGENRFGWLYFPLFYEVEEFPPHRRPEVRPPSSKAAV